MNWYLGKILGKLDSKYNIKSLRTSFYIKVEVIKNHVKIYSKNEMDFYFYEQLKLWRDTEHRINQNEFKSIEERLKKRIELMARHDIKCWNMWMGFTALQLSLLKLPRALLSIAFNLMPIKSKTLYISIDTF